MLSLDLPPQITAFLAQSGRSDGALWAIKLSITTAVRKVSLPVCYKPTHPPCKQGLVSFTDFSETPQDSRSNIFSLIYSVTRQAAERGIQHRGLQRKNEQQLTERLKERLLLWNLSFGQEELHGGLVPLPVLSSTLHFHSYVLCIICVSQWLCGNALHSPQFSLGLQFCASSLKEAEEWVKQIDFVLKGPNA